jgi:hypothetical protein
MEKTYSSETSSDFLQTTGRYNPEGGILLCWVYCFLADKEIIFRIGEIVVEGTRRKINVLKLFSTFMK